MPRVDADFKQRVYDLVVQIPKGKVMTYGQVAALAGAAWAAWEVGQIAHTGPSNLPWQRVVNKQGGLAAGWPNGGKAAHAAALVADGVPILPDFKVDISSLLWNPSQTSPPLIVIAGPTGSGKTSIAIRLAQQFNGEIICADSRTVYKGMDIGTAKPTKLERTKVAHHLIDVSTIDRPITAAEFKTLAQDTIIEVASRGKVPFLVGGTGLYIDAVIFNFSFSPQPSIRDRVKLEKLSVAELQERLTREGIALPENSKNKRHLVRRLEIGGNLPRQTSLRPNTLVLGLKIEREKLKEQISARLDAMLARGLESEVEYLADKYGWGSKALQTIGYQEFKAYFDGSCDLEGVRQAIKTHSLQYAKRQKTWFKRNKHMHYIRSFDEGADLVTTFLNKKAAQ